MNGRTPGGKLKSEIGLDARFALDSLLEEAVTSEPVSGS
jgi:hypothetical protein